MIRPYTRVKVADNTGAREISVIRVLGSSSGTTAEVGDVFIATVKQAISWVAETFGVWLTVDQMRRVFAMLRLRSKIPRPVSERADPAAQEAWKRGA